MLVNISKDPVILSIITLLSSFIFFYLILYLSQPKFVQIVDKNGDTYRSKKLIISFASTFAFVSALTFLLLTTKYEKVQVVLTSNFKFSKPDNTFSL